MATNLEDGLNFPSGIDRKDWMWENALIKRIEDAGGTPGRDVAVYEVKVCLSENGAKCAASGDKW